jgi:urate oxidase
MEHFASGFKRSYYGKGNVTAYRLTRQGALPDRHPVFGADVLMLLYGDAFWPTYATGDNSGLIATDSMKNFIQRETLNFAGFDLESYCHFLCEKFLATYAQVEGIQVTATELPYAGIPQAPAPSRVAFAPAGPDRAFARLEQSRNGTVEFAGGIKGFRLLRLGGSAFHGFVRDAYTTLPDLANRPLHMWLDLEWTYTSASAAENDGRVAREIRTLVHDVFATFESGSIQQLIYQMGTRILEHQSAVASVSLEANNRTWDTIAEEGQTLGVYTDARPPYGCLGLRLTR